jgi:NTP pyrophosphatase (non-canonical NTP hydrolase)
MTVMTPFLKSLRAANLERCALWHPGGVEDWDLNQWFTAMAGEVGEALEAFQQWETCNDIAAHPGNLPSVRKANIAQAETYRTAVCNELADVLIYLDLFAARAGIDLSRTCVRYGTGIGATGSILRAARFACVIGDTVKKLNRDHDAVTGNADDVDTLTLKLEVQVYNAVAALNAAFLDMQAKPQDAVKAKFNAVSERNGFDVFLGKPG